jgi:peptidoglycan/LPS O-acetylase OafA/YrhL
MAPERLPILEPPMQTPADSRTGARWPALTWGAAALAAGSSLSYWLTTDTDTHSWSADAVVSLVAGAALMGLAIALLAGRSSRRTTRATYLVGAAGTAVMLLFLVVPLLQGQPPAEGHAGHAMPAEEPMAAMGSVRIAAEAALIAVLLWLHRLSGRTGAEDH